MKRFLLVQLSRKRTSVYQQLAMGSQLPLAIFHLKSKLKIFKTDRDIKGTISQVDFSKLVTCFFKNVPSFINQICEFEGGGGEPSLINGIRP